MKIAFFSAHEFDKEFFDKENEKYSFEITYIEAMLSKTTADLVKGFDAVCAFVTDSLDAEIIEKISSYGLKLVALRCAGFNNVDLKAATKHGITILRVPAYSPYAVAEHTLALILSLNRKTHKAYNRVREANFSIDGLIGFDLHSKTAGIIGLGKIGSVTAKLLNSFGCKVLAYDPYVKDPADKISLVELDELLASSDIISLHCPLNPDTHHLINRSAIQKMKKGVMLINTSRGAVIDTKAILKGLKDEHIAYLGLDVYEEEESIFFKDHSSEIIQDDTLARLLTFPNTLITSHQGFFTHEAMQNISSTTLTNIDDFVNGKELRNLVS